MNTNVITRFAPSPTGMLHLGSARTALFNYLYARHHGGKFLLRIEDTDRVRSTQDAVQAILQGMSWLDLSWDGDVVFQFERASRHQEVAQDLLAKGRAYRCYCTPEQLQTQREEAMKQGRSPMYDGRCRHRQDHPDAVPYVVRLKASKTGSTVVDDQVQGHVEVNNSELDDMVLLRNDGTPTYMLAVVVDDHDMGVTHVIRGDDHFTNTFRQLQIYQACEWHVPAFAHIPLIHGTDGAKLSKRHGAVSVESYREQGILPEALCNYLLRLGWSHGNDEIISRDQAIAWFDLDQIGRSAARFDSAKLLSLNSHYLKQKTPQAFLEEYASLWVQEQGNPLSPLEKERISRGFQGLVERAKTVQEIVQGSVFYRESWRLSFEELPVEEREILEKAPKEAIKSYAKAIAQNPQADAACLEQVAREHAQSFAINLKDIAQPLRIVITGRRVSPPLFQVMEVLGMLTVQQRLQACSWECGK